MIHITDAQVEQYREIYFREYGKAIECAKARDELMSLVCLLAAVQRHMEQHDWPDLNDI